MEQHIDALQLSGFSQLSTLSQIAIGFRKFFLHFYFWSIIVDVQIILVSGVQHSD